MFQFFSNGSSEASVDGSSIDNIIIAAIFGVMLVGVIGAYLCIELCCTPKIENASDAIVELSP